MVRDCPVCGLVNPDTSPRCDCGFNFEGGSQALQQANACGCGLMAIGLLVFVVSVAITAATITVTGGAWGFVFWGIILAGLGTFAKGLSTYWKTRHY